MARLRGLGIVAMLALVCTGGAGCAARWAYRQGQEAAGRGEWDMAVARLTRALDKDPKNIGYKIALENARIRASRFHYDEAKKHLAANDLVRAADELDIASKYDPSNRSVADDLVIVRKRIEKQEAERRERDDFEDMKTRAESAARQPMPVLAPSANVRIPMARFESENLQKVLEALGKLASVNVMFDEGFRDTKKISLRLGGLTFVELLDRITLVHKLFYKVLDANTILIVPESRQNRIRYDEQLLRTFYLQNAEIDETMNMVKTMTKVTTIASNKALGAITILGTFDQLAMAERVINANDKARGEIVVEVQILEVNRKAVKNWGLSLSSYSASAQLRPTGAEDELSDQGAVLNLRAHLLSSLNQADWVLRVPSSLLTQFLQTDDTSRILAAPRLRAAEGKKTQLEIGTEVPIPVTSIGVGLGNQQAGGLGGYYPSTSFQYKTVGVTMSLEPRVAASGDITLQVNAKFSLPGGDRNVGTQANELLVPMFFSRTIDATLRLKDGETGLIGGLLQGIETSNVSGLLGTKDLPIIGKLLGTRKKSREDSEILISITPRIVRGPKLVEEDFTPLRVGTQEVPRVESARANPFGPEPPKAAGSAAPEVSHAAPPRPAQPASATPAETAPRASFPTAEPVPEWPPEAEPLLDQPSRPTPLPSAEPPGRGSPGPASSAAGPPTSLPTTPSAPSTTVLLSPAEVSVKVGQSAGLSVVLVGAKGVEWIEMTLVYDPQAVELTEAGPGPLLTLGGAPVQPESTSNPGRLRVRFSRSTPIAGSGPVVAVTIKGLKPGSSALALADLQLGRAGGSESPAVPSPGQLVVTP